MDKKILDSIKNADVSEYRALPFWSWNDELKPEELVWQIKWMKENGFGGYFMHARGGLTTEYLGDDWFDCVKACLDAGDEQGMESWAYDENGWPSGFAGGKLLSDPKNCDKYLTTSVGEYDGNALVSYLLEGENLVRTTESGKGEYLNVYEHTSNSTADILNPEVMDKFLELTHVEYKKRMGEKWSSVKGFFTDEPQYFRWAHPYTDMIAKHFKEKYGEDILDGLGLMFVEKEGYRQFRYRYWLGMQSLMLENFGKKIYDWCDENGSALTGHYVEECNLWAQLMCNGGIMPYYEYMHIPGMDHLGAVVGTPVAPKQLSSVARQLGKKRVLTETFACCGWNATPRLNKRIAEWQFVNGVNLMCQHLLPYSEHGQRKRDYPAHYSWSNPWVREDYRTFNDYFARLGRLIAESDEKVSVALFCPMRSMYFDYKRNEEKELPVDGSYVRTAVMLSKYNIPYHIIDETVMEKHAVVDSNKLKVGNCEYDYVIFPLTYTMGSFCADLFETYYENGGKMLFLEGVPMFKEGQSHEYSFKSNVDMESIINAQEFTISDRDTEIQSTHRVYEGKEYIYAVNLSDDKGYTVTFNGNFKGFDCIDLETFETKKVGNTLYFDAGQSYVLFFSDEPQEYESPKAEFTLSTPFEVVDASDNYMLLDKLCYSLDGQNYSPSLRYMGVFDELIKKRYNGEVYLKYTFIARDVPRRLSLLAEDLHNIWCKVNGNEVTFDGVSDFEKQIYRADISSFVKQGENEIIFKINFYESDEVYDVLFGTGTEGLKNKLAYDTTIEACYLQGDFGVYSDKPFVKGETKNVYLADEFYIAQRKDTVSNTLCDGYPFFAGNITLRSVVENPKNKVLYLDGEWCLSTVTVNGKKVEKSYFANKVDLTDYLTDGKNEILVTLFSGNRNLLGPHHCAWDEEPLWVGPHTWELVGSWTDGVSSQELPRYAFIRFGLFDKE